jgi:hypothetical protein
MLNVEITLLPDGVIHWCIPYDPNNGPIYGISPLGEEASFDVPSMQEKMERLTNAMKAGCQG